MRDRGTSWIMLEDTLVENKVFRTSFIHLVYTSTYARAATYNSNQNVYVCCNTDVQKDICKIYSKAGYDFRSFVISQCLGHASNPANNEDQYICTLCDKRLQETGNENPVLPYYGKYPNAVAGANFLKALNQRPEYVCRCCRHMLFHKTV